MRFPIKALFAFLFLVLASNASASVIINEVMMDPDVVSDTYGEWFELYNNGEIAVDINGWVIRDGNADDHLIDNGGSLIIAPKGFLVLGRNGSFESNGGYLADYVYSGFLLANEEDEIILENGGLEVARIEYDSNWPVYAGRSMIYKGYGDVNAFSSWTVTPAEDKYIFGDGDYGTPGVPNMIPEPATVFLLTAGLLGMAVRRRKKL